MLESQFEDITATSSTVEAAARSQPRAEPDGAIWFKRQVRPGQALRDLWAFRGLIRALAERDLRVRYKQAALGFAWAFVTPIVMMLAFTLVFTKFGHVETG